MDDLNWETLHFCHFQLAELVSRCLFGARCEGWWSVDGMNVDGGRELSDTARHYASVPYSDPPRNRALPEVVSVVLSFGI